MTVLDTTFTGCAVVGGALLLVRIVLMFVAGGLDADVDVDADVDLDLDIDADVDVGDVDAGEGTGDAGLRLLSLHSIMAFLLMFGLVGLTLRREADATGPVAILGAMIAGVFCFWLMAKMVQLLKSLQSSGTVALSNAIGQEGSVYLTIPPGGTGKVQAIVNGRLMVLNATAEKGEELRTGEKVTVVDFSPPNTLVVDKV